LLSLARGTYKADDGSVVTQEVLATAEITRDADCVYFSVDDMHRAIKGY